MIAVEKSREGKPVSFSAIENQRINLFEEHMSPHGFIFGNRILDIIDEYTMTVANKHSEMKCQTTGINFVRFFSQAKRGDVLVCMASVNRSWEKSLEVGVKVIAEDFRTLEKKQILSAYFTFEPTEEDDSLSLIPHVISESEEQRRRYIEALSRKTKTHKYLNISHLNKKDTE